MKTQEYSDRPPSWPMIVGIAVPTTLESSAASESAVRIAAVIASCSRVIGGSGSSCAAPVLATGLEARVAGIAAAPSIDLAVGKVMKKRVYVADATFAVPERAGRVCARSTRRLPTNRSNG